MLDFRAHWIKLSASPGLRLMSYSGINIAGFILPSDDVSRASFRSAGVFFNKKREDIQYKYIYIYRLNPLKSEARLNNI
jgi:hypothetical protein